MDLNFDYLIPINLSRLLLISGHADPLPSGWKQFYDQGKTVYLNEQTGQKTFVDPRLGKLNDLQVVNIYNILIKFSPINQSINHFNNPMEINMIRGTCLSIDLFLSGIAWPHQA